MENKKFNVSRHLKFEYNSESYPYDMTIEELMTVGIKNTYPELKFKITNISPSEKLPYLVEEFLKSDYYKETIIEFLGNRNGIKTEITGGVVYDTYKHLIDDVVRYCLSGVIAVPHEPTKTYTDININFPKQKLSDEQIEDTINSKNLLDKLKEHFKKDNIYGLSTDPCGEVLLGNKKLITSVLRFCLKTGIMYFDGKTFKEQNESFQKIIDQADTFLDSCETADEMKIWQLAFISATRKLLSDCKIKEVKDHIHLKAEIIADNFLMTYKAKREQILSKVKT